MKRHKVDLHHIVEWDNLCLAAAKAARAKRDRDEVKLFFKNFEKNILQLRNRILLQQAPVGQYKSFRIHDPKPRIIHAACFEDRILHHAIMNLAGPIFEKAMIADSYACLPQKGTLKALHRVQHYLERAPWFVKIDIKHFFPNICHQRLMVDLSRLFKGKEFLSLLEKIVNSYEYHPQRGLPIGSLTSQYFANYHLDDVDRWIQSLPIVKGCVRYMDDLIWWTSTANEAKQSLYEVVHHIETQKDLTVKPNSQINRSRYGVTYCGMRMFPTTIRLTQRRKQRYQQRRAYWEQAYDDGYMTDVELQQAMASVYSTIVHANSLSWRQTQLKRKPSSYPEG